MSRPLVFIIDDHEHLCSSLKWILEGAGYRVETYPSAEAFLSFAQRERGQCLILDHQLPGVTGVALLEQLKESLPWLPIIVMTGHGDERIAERVRRAGAHAFLEKPCYHESLLEQVRTATAA